MKLKNLKSFDTLREVFRILHGPNGCPWDKAQTFKSITKHIEEESVELIEAVNSENVDHIIEELGDMLLLVMLYSEIATREGKFEISDVIYNLNKKLIRRHPHVFSDTKVSGKEEALEIWKKQKELEKKKC